MQLCHALSTSISISFCLCLPFIMRNTTAFNVPANACTASHYFHEEILSCTLLHSWSTFIKLPFSEPTHSEKWACKKNATIQQIQCLNGNGVASPTFDEAIFFFLIDVNIDCLIPNFKQHMWSNMRQCGRNCIIALILKNVLLLPLFIWYLCIFFLFLKHTLHAWPQTYTKSVPPII